MGMFVFSREAKELCLESWAFAARALFHRAFISMEARYNVCGKQRRAGFRTPREHQQPVGDVQSRSLVQNLLSVGTRMQAGHQVQDVAERHRVQVFNK